MEKDAEKAKAEKIVLGMYCDNECCQENKLCGRCKADITTIAQALSAARSEGYNEAIAEAVKVAENHSAVGGGCPLSDESVRSYNEAVKQITDSINKLKRG